MPLLEEGTYFGKLAEIGTDQLHNDRKTPYIYVVWDVTHRAAGGQWEAIQPERRESRWWATDKAEAYTMDRLLKLGFNGDFERPEFSAQPHPDGTPHRGGLRCGAPDDLHRPAILRQSEPGRRLSPEPGGTGRPRRIVDAHDAKTPVSARGSRGDSTRETVPRRRQRTQHRHLLFH
jgi:hypothetical protein